MGAAVAGEHPRRDRPAGGVLTLIDVRVPDEQEGTKAVVRAWLKQIGDAVAENDPLVELETDKVTQEVPAPAAGVLAEIVLDTDAEAVPGALLARIETDECPGEGRGPGGEACRSHRTAPGGAPGPRPAPGNSGETRLSPRSAAPASSTASTRRASRAPAATAASPARTSTAPSPRRPWSASASRRPRSRGSSRRSDIPHDRMRLTIAENMVARGRRAPHVTAVFEADFSAVAAHKAAMAAKGVKLSYTAYIVKAAAEAMAVAPAINGRWEEDRIAISPTIDIGVGTALGEKGLVVPVVKDAGSLSLEQIGAKLDDLTRRARDGKLERSDVSGGSFTISNHGVSGSLLAAPIILHQGQAAILGIGKLEKRVVVREVDGQRRDRSIRPMAYVTLTIDHRVVDGHQTNAWLTRFVEILESWPAA